MTRRLWDWCVPAGALRFDRTHPMTVDPGPLLTEWERQFYRQHPIPMPDGFIRGPFYDENMAAFELEFDIGSRTPPEAFREDRP